MKKLIAFFLAAVIVCSVTGCKTKTPPGSGENTLTTTPAEAQDTEPQPTDTTPVVGPEYQSDALSLVEEAAQFDGRLNDIYPYGVGQMAYYVGDTLYEKDIAAGWESFWDEWKIGAGKDIVYFDGAIVVAEAADGSLTAYCKTPDTNNADGGICAYELKDATSEEFRFAVQPIGSTDMAYIYREGDVCYYAVVKTDGETSVYKLCEAAEEPEDACPIIDFYPDGVGACVKLQCGTVYNTFGMNLTFDLVSDEELGNFCYLTMREETALENIDTVYVESRNYLWASKNGDTAHIYGYLVHDFDSQRAGLGYWDKPIKIALPEGYETKDIASVSGANEILIHFTDNEVYYVDTTYMKAEPSTENMPMERIAALDVYRDNVMQLYFQEACVYALMDDGYMYEVQK